MRVVQILSTIFWLAFIPATLMASDKIDTIYFQNGDRVTGEVKSLENDLLRLSTDDAGTVSIEWTKVDSVFIRNRMRILLMNGEILYGMLLPSGVAKSCMIWGSAGDPRLVVLDNIIELSPIEENFFNRWSGSISSGFSYTKASEVMQMNLNGSLKYLANKNLIETSYSGNVTSDPLGTTQRQNGGFTFHRMLPKKWFLVAELLAESNSALQLDLRTSFGMGAGNSIVRTNSSHLYVAAGILTNRELSEAATQNNIEGLVTANYSVYIYDNPEVSFDISTNVIPSFNDPGRVRSETESNLKWEIFSDFYLKWSFYYSFDSKPLSGGAEKSDWGITLLGLEYKL
ncbi:MAG: DUF481 domain-containing protein [Bacteroidales bacterium]|nr:DUF481 domain-containing protein [Bacteroidales bacterium]